MSMSFFRRLRAIAEPESLSRRDMLMASGTAVGAICFQDRLTAAPVAKEVVNGRRVVVIGAGFAGLACADELATSGHKVTVLEARKRIGGRVHSNTDLVEGQTVEAGGELVGPNQPTWQAYAKRFSLKFSTMEDGDTDVIVLDGKQLGKAASTKLWKEMREALRKLNDLAKPIDAYKPWEHKDAKTLDNQSLRDWIDNQNVGDECKKCMAVQFTAINGIVPAWQSLLGVLAIVKGGGLDDFWNKTDTQHVDGGCDQLAKKLETEIVNRGGYVKLNCPVRSVRFLKDKVEVVFVEFWDKKKVETRVECDHVVLTAPPSVWNKIDFTPALPPGLITPLADNVKYLAVTDGQPWKVVNRDVKALSNGNVQLTWETTDDKVEGGEHAIVAITGGPGADVCRTWAKEGKLDAKYHAVLDGFWPGFAKAAAGKEGRIYDWLSDPYSRGSYSFPAPGQVTVAGPLLAKGIGGRLHFAGEHCCYAFTGWMEGALSSGVNVAKQIGAIMGKNEGQK